MKKIVFLIACLLVLSCNQKKTENENSLPENDNEKIEAVKTISGEVVEIKQGKDGYTATIKTKTNEIYFGTISRSNLRNPEQYKEVQLGEQLKITGDFWIMENENQLTVREIVK